VNLAYDLITGTVAWIDPSILPPIDEDILLVHRKKVRLGYRGRGGYVKIATAGSVYTTLWSDIEAWLPKPSLP